MSNTLEEKAREYTDNIVKGMVFDDFKSSDIEYAFIAGYNAASPPTTRAKRGVEQIITVFKSYE